MEQHTSTTEFTAENEADALGHFLAHDSVKCEKEVIMCGQPRWKTKRCHTSKQIENFFQERGVKVKREKSPLSSARTNYFKKVGGVTI